MYFLLRYFFSLKSELPGYLFEIVIITFFVMAKIMIKAYNYYSGFQPGKDIVLNKVMA